MTLYYEGDTWLHGLNPLVKLFSATAAVFTAGLLASPGVLALHLAYSLLLAASARPRLNRLVAAGGLAAVAGQWWVNTALYHYNMGVPWADAVWRGGLLAARVAIVLLYSIAFISTTSPRSLAVALSAQLRIPYVYSYMSFVTLRMLPLMARDLENIRAARLVRGYRGSGNPVSRLAGILAPLLSVAVRRSVQMGIAMEARGFGAYPERSYVDPPALGRGDFFFAAATAAVILISITVYFL